MKVEVKTGILRKVKTSEKTFFYEKVGSFTRVYDIEFLDSEESIIINGIKHVFIHDCEYTFKLLPGNKIKGLYKEFKKMIIEYINGDKLFACILERVLEKLAKKTVATCFTREYWGILEY